MADILIGFGEVGSALYDILNERRHILIHDPPKGFEEPFPRKDAIEWMHVSIPYSDSFIDTVLEYRNDFYPRFIVIHSTVPVGTTRTLCEKMGAHGSGEFGSFYVYYSPIRGRHPNLSRGIRSFPKWYASEWDGNADFAFEGYFAMAGMQTRKAPNTDILELMKLWETTSFALQLIMWAEIENETKTLPGEYQRNIGAMKSWLWEKRKCYDGDIGLVPVLDLVPGPLGGHCLRSNIELVRDRIHPSLYDWLTTVDDMRKINA